MKRRDFLIATAGASAAALPAAVWAQARPCPPPSVSVNGGSSVTTSCSSSSGLPELRLVSGAGSGTYGWTVGQCFRKGQVAAQVTATGESIQCDVRNRWSDGSVKFAVLSGVSALAPSKTLQLVSGTSAAGAALAESNVSTILNSADVVVTLGSYGAVSLRSLVGTGAASANSAGRVRTAVSGPLMSEFHYMGVPAGGDAHLRVWFYVRVYSNSTLEVETVVENGWFLVASPGEKIYSPTVAVGAATVYSPGSITHRHHTRWGRVDWVGTDPQITPLHDMSYVRSTRLIPNYGWGSPSAAVLNALYQNLSPTPGTDRGMYNADYYGGGDKDGIGLLPHWVALWGAASATADARAVKSVIAHARVAYRYANFYRDETTMRPPRMATNSAYARIGLTSSGTTQSGHNNVGASLDFVPATTGTFPQDQICDRSHAVQDFYAAYLLTGRWPFLDASQHKQIAYAIVSGSTGRNYNECRFVGPETRGRGWVMRDCALTLAITPDDDPFRNELQTIWANNMSWLRATFATPSAPNYDVAGWFDHISATGESAYGDFGATKGGAYWWDVPWMHWFNVAALGLAKDVEVPASSQATDDLDVNLAHYSKICAGQTSDGSGGGFHYRRACPRDSMGRTGIPVGTNGGMLPLETKYTWPQIYSVLQTELAIPALPGGNTLVANDNTEITTGDFDCSASNFGHFIAALALAASYDAGCLAGYQRLAGTTTWSSRATAWNNTPKAGIAPRT